MSQTHEEKARKCFDNVNVLYVDLSHCIRVVNAQGFDALNPTYTLSLIQDLKACFEDAVEHWDNHMQEKEEEKDE